MKLVKSVFFAWMVVMPLAVANVAFAKMAVVNSEMAVVESDSAKRYAAETEKRFAPRIAKLKNLQAEIKTLEEKLQKDAPTLSSAMQDSRRLEIKRKFEDLQMQDRQLRAEKARSDQAELGKLRPLLDKAIQEVSKEMGLDLVIERGAVRYVKSELDITRKVIERLNKMKLNE